MLPHNPASETERCKRGSLMGRQRVHKAESSCSLTRNTESCWRAGLKYHLSGAGCERHRNSGLPVGSVT
ncbi:hypothetical protein PBY51_023032 [Eleginops maclovinus]|uniref:Uncharacterized protein n=1 Tax=Eleginops maclovinus TaxID=56733 RepID=A0AAN7X244_ELEMC|nr:hypothetical protein PBY51_023032 [Eleginops maclovinus]